MADENKKTVNNEQTDLANATRKPTAKDKKILEYHMKSTNSVAFLENDSETPDVEMQEDDFDW